MFLVELWIRGIVIEGCHVFGRNNHVETSI